MVGRGLVFPRGFAYNAPRFFITFIGGKVNEMKRMNGQGSSWNAAVLGWGVLLLPWMMAACSGLGPSTIRGDRANYNTAIQRSNDQQLLLNLVRLKYRDTPFFLEVSNVAAQFKFRSNANANATLQNGVKGLFGLGAGATVEESPTVTYAPLSGEQFIQRFLSQVPLETVFLLSHSGWSIERIFRICLQRMGELKNAPNASGPTPNRAPVFMDFVQAVRMFRQLQLRDALTVSLGARGKVPELVMRVRGEPGEFPELRGLNRLLGFPPENTRFVLTVNPSPAKGEGLRIETRSLLGILYFLSHGVETPTEDREQGKITLTRRSSGKLFDWGEVTGDILKIHSQSSRPGRAAVDVFYRDQWFYIDDSDLNSKSTFSLLAQLFSLQAGKAKDRGLLLTLPLGN